MDIINNSKALFKQDITRLSSVNILTKSKKKTMLASLNELTEQMPSLLEIDHPCAQRPIADARYMVEVCKMLSVLYQLLSSGV